MPTVVIILRISSRPHVGASNESTLSLFFRSLLPNFNLQVSFFEDILRIKSNDLIGFGVLGLLLKLYFFLQSYHLSDGDFRFPVIHKVNHDHCDDLVLTNWSVSVVIEYHSKH